MLRWYVEKVKNHEVITTSKEDKNKWHWVTMEIVNATMYTGITKITAKNYEEFYYRMMLWNKCVNSTHMSTDVGIPIISLEDVKRHIGLYTNANPKTKTKFFEHLRKNILEKAVNYEYSVIKSRKFTEEELNEMH